VLTPPSPSWKSLAGIGKRIAHVALLLAVVAAIVATVSASRGPVLTEFGATRKVWFAHHTPDAKYQNGCCFLPKQRDGTDRYYTVHYGAGTHVDMFEMGFAPTISVVLARLVVLHEAGPGARLVYDLKPAGCEQIEYRSALLSRAIGGAMFAELSRNGGTGGAPKGHVGDILFIALPVGAHPGC
jgi:hypothetical protein